LNQEADNAHAKQATIMKSLTEKVQGIERDEIINALSECNWVMSRAAKRLGITERMIGYKIKKYHTERRVIFKTWESLEMMRSQHENL
jgi:transcriptional regulator with GAF, ATPase, and Fis domain